MKPKHPHLCSPITIGNVTFRNRMFAAPVGGTDITADCSVGPRTPAFYEMKAKGGAASVTASELVVHPATDASHMFHLNLTTPGNLARWTWVADAIMRHGAVPSIELSHSGQYAGTYLVDKDKKKGLTQFGPSDWVRPDGIPVKALTKEQIDDIVKAYGDAAALAKRVGFQMVMVHCGHGWLINQFLYFNDRKNWNVDEDGQLYAPYVTNEYREAMKYMNKLYTEKLIDQDIFTMDYAQEIAKCTTGRALNYIMVNNSPVSNSEFEQYTLGIKEPFTGYNGEKMWTAYSLPASTSGQFMITYKCAEKGEDAIKAAVRWMDHWYSDEGIISYFMGVEGVTYEKDENSPGGLKLTDAVLNSPDGRTFEQVLAEYVPWAGGANPSVASNEYFKGGETWPVCLEAVEGLRNYYPETVWAPFDRYYTTEESAEMASIKPEQEQYWKEWRAYFVTGQKDINGIPADYSITGDIKFE